MSVLPPTHPNSSHLPPPRPTSMLDEVLHQTDLRMANAVNASNGAVGCLDHSSNTVAHQPIHVQPMTSHHTLHHTVPFCGPSSAQFDHCSPWDHQHSSGISSSNSAALDETTVNASTDVTLGRQLTDGVGKIWGGAPSVSSPASTSNTDSAIDLDCGRAKSNITIMPMVGDDFRGKLSMSNVAEGSAASGGSATVSNAAQVEQKRSAVSNEQSKEKVEVNTPLLLSRPHSSSVDTDECSSSTTLFNANTPIQMRPQKTYARYYADRMAKNEKDSKTSTEEHNESQHSSVSDAKGNWWSELLPYKASTIPENLVVRLRNREVTTEYLSRPPSSCGTSIVALERASSRRCRKPDSVHRNNMVQSMIAFLPATPDAPSTQEATQNSSNMNQERNQCPSNGEDRSKRRYARTYSIGREKSISHRPFSLYCGEEDVRIPMPSLEHLSMRSRNNARPPLTMDMNNECKQPMNGNQRHPESQLAHAEVLNSGFGQLSHLNQEITRSDSPRLDQYCRLMQMRDVRQQTPSHSSPGRQPRLSDTLPPRDCVTKRPTKPHFVAS